MTISANRISRMHHWLLAALIFFIPLQTRYIFTDPMILGAPWEGGRISLYGFDLLFLLALATSVPIWERYYNRRWMLFTFFAIVLILSFSYTMRLDLAIYQFVRIVEGFVFFGMCVRATALERSRYMIAWIAAGIVQTFVSVVQFSMQSFPSSKWFGLSGLDPSQLGTAVIETMTMRVLRAYGTFPHPNMLAGFLVIGIFLSLVLYRETSNRVFKTIALAGFLIQQVGLFFTFSRSGIAALGIGLFTVISYELYRWGRFQTEFERRRWRSPVVLLIVIILWSVLAANFSQLLAPRITRATRLEQQSIQEREEAVIDSLSLWTNHPLIGHGVGNATVELSKLHPNRSAYDIEPPHNIIILLLLETGILGLLAALLIYGGSLWSTLSGTRPHVLLFSGLIAMSVLAMLDHYFWTQGAGVLMFWSAFALFQPLAVGSESP